MNSLVSMLPLLILVALLWLVFKGSKKKQGSSGEALICTACGTETGSPKIQTKGSFAMELVLWLIFIVPGLIYSVWRLTTRQKVCPACSSPALIPLNTPAGKNLATRFKSGQV